MRGLGQRGGTEIRPVVGVGWIIPRGGALPEPQTRRHRDHVPECDVPEARIPLSQFGEIIGQWIVETGDEPFLEGDTNEGGGERLGN